MGRLLAADPADRYQTANDVIRDLRLHTGTPWPLEPGGLLVVGDVFTDAGGCSPPFAALFGLNMLLTAPDGGVHADADVAQWMLDAGFATTDIRAFPPPLPHRVVIGTAD